MTKSDVKVGVGVLCFILNSSVLVEAVKAGKLGHAVLILVGVIMSLVCFVSGYRNLPK